ncbi:MAG: hypothetical protein KBC02_02005 [Candidatus Pacebacteria bacterium]|nr:hypothetical protein [Candidatus Paceibacterota bacterium]
MSLRQTDRHYTSVAAVTADLELGSQVRKDLLASQETHRQRLRFWSLIAHRSDGIEKVTAYRPSPDEWAAREAQLLDNDTRQLDELTITIAMLAQIKKRLETMPPTATPKAE